jgi:hypothetical protein
MNKRAYDAYPRITHDLLGRLHALGLSIAESPVTPRQLGSILDLIGTDKISGTIGKNLLRIMIEEHDPSRLADVIVAERGLEKVTDVKELRQVCRDVIEAYPQQVGDKRLLISPSSIRVADGGCKWNRKSGPASQTRTQQHQAVVGWTGYARYAGQGRSDKGDPNS